MGRGKEFNDEEKREIIKELAKSTPLENIAKKYMKSDMKSSRHLVTVKRFVHDPMKKRKTRSDRGILKSVTKQDLNNFKKITKSTWINQQKNFPGVWSNRHPQTTRNRILGRIAKHKASKKGLHSRQGIKICVSTGPGNT